MPNFTRVYRNFYLGLDKRSIEGVQARESAFDLDGVVLSGDGGFSKLPGRTVIVSSGFSGAPVRYLTHFDNSAGVRTYVAYTDDGGTATWWSWTYPGGTVTSLGTVTAGGHVDADQFEGLLVLVGTRFVPQKWNGSGSIASLAGTPASVGAGSETLTLISDSTSFTAGNNPSLVAAHKNRLWMSGDTNFPSKVYYSVLFNGESWVRSATDVSRGGSMDIFPLDGKGAITKIVSWQDKLVVFKERAIYFITGSHPLSISGPDPFAIDQLVLPYGTNSRHSVVKQDNDILFLDINKYYRSLQNTITNAEAQTLNVSYNVQPIFDKLPIKALPYVVATDYVKRNHIWISHYEDYAEFSVDSNTRALYHLDGLTDTTANALTLTNNNSTPNHLGFNNYFRDCFDFTPASSHYLNRSAAAGTNASTAYTALTVEAWIRPDTLPTSGNSMYIFHEASASGNFALYLNNNAGTQRIVASVTDSGGTERIAGYNTSISTSAWTYLVLTWDGATVTLYVNAVSQATAAAASIRTNQTTGFSIGATTAGASFFDGRIDEVRVSNTNRSLGTLETFYNGVSTTNDIVQILDYGKKDSQGRAIKAWSKTTDIIKPGHIQFIDNRLFTGTYSGTIHEQDSGNTHGLSRREGFYTLPWDDLSDLNPLWADLEKRVNEIEVWLTAFQTGKLNVEWSYDDRSGNSQQIEMNASAETTWGSNWDTELIWSSGTGRRLYKYKVYANGHGTMYQLKLFGSQESVQFTCLQMIIRGEIMKSPN